MSAAFLPARAAGGIVGNRVLALLLVIIALAAVLLPFVAVAPNRIVSGRPAGLWSSADPVLAAAAVIEFLVLGLAALRRPERGAALLAAVASTLLLLTLILAAGSAGERALAATGLPGTRTSLGSAFWIGTLGAALALSDALGRLRLAVATRFATGLALACGVVLIALSGRLDTLSLAREFVSRQDAFAGEFLRHVGLVGAALLPALVVGTGLGALVLARPSTGGIVFAVLNIIQTIPSIALFGLLIGPLTSLSEAFPALRDIGLRGIGFVPAAIALTLYGLLPVARSVHAAFSGVPVAVVDSARGMGMTRGQTLRSVELPLALPVLLSGLRIVLIQLIGLAVVAALIGAGGLGTFVFQGLGQTATDLVLLGALSAIGLALVADGLLRSIAAAVEG